MLLFHYVFGKCDIATYLLLINLLYFSRYLLRKSATTAKCCLKSAADKEKCYSEQKSNKLQIYEYIQVLQLSTSHRDIFPLKVIPPRVFVGAWGTRWAHRKMLRSIRSLFIRSLRSETILATESWKMKPGKILFILT